MFANIRGEPSAITERGFNVWQCCRNCFHSYNPTFNSVITLRE
jgi:hypothetical protein